MPFSDYKTVLVTGASSGIGAASRARAGTPSGPTRAYRGAAGEICAAGAHKGVAPSQAHERPAKRRTSNPPARAAPATTPDARAG